MLQQSVGDSMKDGSIPCGMVVSVGSGSLQSAVRYADGRVLKSVDVRWQCEPADALSRIEDAVYEHPALFDDIPTAVLLSPTLSTLAPEELLAQDSEKAVERILDQFVPAKEKECFSESMEGVPSTRLLYTLPSGVYSFIERCFPTESIHHCLTPLISHFAKSARTERGDRIWVDVHGGVADTIAFRDGELILANTWHWRAETDIVYYLVYVWRTLRFDNSGGQLHLSAPTEIRNRLTSELRRYIDYVTLPSLPRDVKESIAEGLPLSMVLTLRNMLSAQQ